MIGKRVKIKKTVADYSENEIFNVNQGPPRSQDQNPNCPRPWSTSMRCGISAAWVPSQANASRIAMPLRKCQTQVWVFHTLLLDPVFREGKKCSASPCGDVLQYLFERKVSTPSLNKTYPSQGSDNLNTMKSD